MSWKIHCNDKLCNHDTWARNIVDLIESHLNNDGWFICEKCGGTGHIEKRFDMQEGGNWEPYLRGIIRLGAPDDVYQPFVFIVSHKEDGPPDSVWVSYYKDLRDGEYTNKRLKLGYGPGGPPVLEFKQLQSLIERLNELKVIVTT